MEWRVLIWQVLCAESSCGDLQGFRFDGFRSIVSHARHGKYSPLLIWRQPMGLDKREIFDDETRLNIVWWTNILPSGPAPYLMLFDRVWSYWIVSDKFEGHQILDHKLKSFLLLSCLMGDPLFVWTASYQTCLMRACVPRLLSGLYQLFDLCFIKHVLTVWPLTWTSACLVTKQCLMVFGRQTFLVCPGLMTLLENIGHMF